MKIISKETSPPKFRVTSENNTEEFRCIISLKQLASSAFGDKYLPGARVVPTVTTWSFYHDNTLCLPGWFIGPPHKTQQWYLWNHFNPNRYPVNLGVNEEGTEGRWPCDNASDSMPYGLKSPVVPLELVGHI